MLTAGIGSHGSLEASSDVKIDLQSANVGASTSDEDRLHATFVCRNIKVDTFVGAEGPDRSQGKVLLSLYDNAAQSRGSVEVLGLSDVAATMGLEGLFADEHANATARTITPEGLLRALKEFEEYGGRLNSDLGASAEEIVRHYRAFLASDRPSKPHYRFIDLLNGVCVRPHQEEFSTIRSRSSGAIRWIDISNPSHGLLESIAKDLELSNGTVRLCLEDQQPITANGHKETLFISTKELRFDPESGVLTKSPLTMIIGKGFVVTLHQGRSAAADRVWAEARTQEVMQDDLGSTNYLACRIFGSTVYAAKEAIEQLARESEHLNGRYLQPSRNDLTRAEQLSHSAREAESVMLHLGEVIAALREERHRYGAAKPKESLSRYSAIVRSSLDQSRIVEERVADKRQSWGIEAQNLSNQYTSRLSIAIAALSVPGVIFGFFGQNFAENPFSNMDVWLMNGLGVAASSALVGGLWFLTHRERHRKPHQPLPLDSAL